MAKDNSLTISAPTQGIASSPHVGFGDVRNLDIYTLPGIVRLNNLLAKQSASIVTGLIKWKKKNPLNPSEVWGLDDAGVVYKSTNSGSTWAVVAGNTAGGSGQGLEIFKDYLITARSASIDVYGPLSSSPAWTNSWKTIDADTLWHPMLISKNDNMLYGGAGRFIFSLDEATGQTFTPGNSATFVWTQQALDLPPNYRIKSLAELGNNLEIGTWMGSNIYDFKVADIFPWDRSSPSFGEPLALNENGVNAMLTIENILYILAGIDGKVFSSNGVSASLIGQIPEYIADIEGGLWIEPMPGAFINFKGRPFFGMSVGSSGNIGGMGIWSILQTSKGNKLVLEHTISTGSDGFSSVVKVGALLGITRDTLIAGWRDGSNYGIDLTNNTARNTGYTGYFDSPFYNVGTPLNKRTFSQAEFQLTKPLATGQGVRFKYRTAINAAWTIMNGIVYDFTLLGAVSSHEFNPDIVDAEFVQIRAELTADASSNDSPQFKNLILK